MAGWHEHRRRLAAADEPGGRADAGGLLAWSGAAATHAALVRSVAARLDELAGAWRQPRLVLHWRFPPRGGLDAVLAARVDVRVVSRPHGGAAATVLALSATLSGSTAHLALTGGASAPPALVQDAATALLAGGAAICCRDGGEALAASLSGLLRAVVKAG